MGILTIAHAIRSLIEEGLPEVVEFPRLEPINAPDSLGPILGPFIAGLVPFINAGILVVYRTIELAWIFVATVVIEIFRFAVQCGLHLYRMTVQANPWRAIGKAVGVCCLVYYLGLIVREAAPIAYRYMAGSSFIDLLILGAFYFGAVACVIAYTVLVLSQHQAQLAGLATGAIMMAFLTSGIALRLGSLALAKVGIEFGGFHSLGPYSITMISIIVMVAASYYLKRLTT